MNDSPYIQAVINQSKENHTKTSQLDKMKFALIVGVGSFFGGASRYLLSNFVQEKTSPTFPYGTFAVNLIGCFLIGCLFGLSEKWQLNLEWRLIFITGFLGGFTTFSAFSAETHYLFRTGHTLMGFAYIGGSIILGISLTYLGAWLFRFEPPKM